jgi:hypothetical protein
MFLRHALEMNIAIENDTTGDGFIFQMFDCELCNHEYIVSGNVENTLEALGFTFDKVNNDKRLLHGLRKAMKAQPKY